MSPLPSQLPLRCWAEIDLAALERNLRLIRASLPAHMRYVAVVKADAYGHGLPQTSARLMHAGADLFAVATLSEAVAVRELGPGWPVLLLSPLLPEEDRYLAEYDLSATVSSIDEIKRLDAVGRVADKCISVHLKVDTGMGRLGVWHEQTPTVFAAISASPNVRLDGVFTHFASPEDFVYTAEQRRRFLAALDCCQGLQLDRLFVHADNSAGIETLPGASPFNAVRIGLLQFGILPQANSLLSEVHTEPVLSLKTRVGLVKDLPQGQTVSYGRTQTLQRNTKVAILCAGYGDAIPRAMSNRAEVLIKGLRCKVLGRVTMDQTIVDVTDLPLVNCGEEVVLVGKQLDASISISEYSSWADTIPWETLCSVTKRVPRIYRTSLGV